MQEIRIIIVNTKTQTINPKKENLIKTCMVKQAMNLKFKKRIKMIEKIMKISMNLIQIKIKQSKRYAMIII